MTFRLRHSEWIILDLLSGVILDNIKGCVVDIGIGPSTEILRKHSKSFEVRHHSCDINGKRCDWARSVGCEVYEMQSLDFIKEFNDPPVALVFIDGDHKYETVKQEVRFFLPLLSYGGVIFLHDTNPLEKYRTDDGTRCGDVYKFRGELEKDPSLQVFTWPYTAAKCGLTMIMGRLKQETWK